MKTTLILTLILHCILSTYADIRPNPIAAKGIIAGISTSIRMDSELVVVDLYKDSASVECTFYMKNDDKAQDLTIGFPQMYFNFFLDNNQTQIEKYYVSENGERKKIANIHHTNEMSEEENLLFAEFTNQSYDNQAWIVWKSSFKEGEMKTIVVRYTLPYGPSKSGRRFFTYYLHTGSGWKGTIGKAEILVNLKDLTTDLLFETRPENYKIQGKQLSWTFTDFEPTKMDDIKIYYEPYKGYLIYRNNAPTLVVNDIPYVYDINALYPGNIDFLTSLSKEFLANIINVPPEAVESFKVLKDKESTKKYKTENAVLLIYTKNYLKNTPKGN